MVHQRTENSFVRTVMTSRRLAVTSLAVFVAVVGASAQASAETMTGRQGSAIRTMSFDRMNGVPAHDNNGNGKDNFNSFTIHSPVFNHGIQHTNNAAVGGDAINQNAFCKKGPRHCKITERLVVLRR
jgi:hypothetical protein